MTKKHLKKIELSDGITLDVWDLSRVVAGDRWLVSLEISGDIPLKKEYFDNTKEPDTAFLEAQKAFGPTIWYEYKRERNFIDEKVKDEIFKELLTVFEKNILPYMSKPEFFKRFVLSKYNELKQNPYKCQKVSN